MDVTHCCRQNVASKTTKTVEEHAIVSPRVISGCENMKVPKTAVFFKCHLTLAPKASWLAWISMLKMADLRALRRIFAVQYKK